MHTCIMISSLLVIRHRDVNKWAFVIILVLLTFNHICWKFWEWFAPADSIEKCPTVANMNKLPSTDLYEGEQSDIDGLIVMSESASAPSKKSNPHRIMELLHRKG